MYSELPCNSKHALQVHSHEIKLKTVSAVRFSPNHKCRVKIGRALDLTRIVVLQREDNEVREEEKVKDISKAMITC